MDVKPIQPDEEVLLLCKRTSKPAPVPSVMMICQQCRASVWVSRITLASIQKQPSARLETICTVCHPPDPSDAKITPETFGEAMRHG